MKLITRAVKELSATEYHSCYTLNLGDQGLMRSKLVMTKLTSTAVMLIEDDGVLLSWSLVFPYDLDNELYGAYFYTRHNARRKGYGNLVAREVTQLFPNVIVWPSDNQGRDFFDNYQFQQSFRYWAEL